VDFRPVVSTDLRGLIKHLILVENEKVVVTRWKVSFDVSKNMKSVDQGCQSPLLTTIKARGYLPISI
jgi:hypothetical protein